MIKLFMLICLADGTECRYVKFTPPPQFSTALECRAALQKYTTRGVKVRWMEDLIASGPAARLYKTRTWCSKEGRNA